MSLIDEIEDLLKAQRSHFVVFAPHDRGSLARVVRVAQALDRPLYIHKYQVGHPFHLDIARWTPLEGGLCHCCTDLGNALQTRDTVVVIDVGLPMEATPPDVFEVLDKLQHTRKLSFNAAEGSHVVRLAEGVQFVVLFVSSALVMTAPYRLYVSSENIKDDGNGIDVAPPDNGGNNDS